MTRVSVTGAGGRIGSALVAELRGAGHEVVAIDVGRWPVSGGVAYRRGDLRELWQAREALRDAEAVVHLAALGTPEPGLAHHAEAEQAVFATNLVSAYNVFMAAAAAGVRRVVWASSETVMGTPFRPGGLVRAPLDEDCAVAPTAVYALSKALTEELARHVGRWTGVSIVGLRLSVVMDAADYAGLRRHWADPEAGAWNLWSYIDLRDAVRACMLALEAPAERAGVYVAAAADTTMDRPTRELLATVAPGLGLPDGFPEHGSLLSSERARRALGYEARHTWR